MSGGVGKRKLVSFAEQWRDAGSHIVQHWQLWEDKAADAFGVVSAAHGEGMHAVMLIVCCVCFGDHEAVKFSLRSAAPSDLTLAWELLGHMQPFTAVLEAERLFRACRLVDDWDAEPQPDGRVVIRSVHRSSDGGTEH